MKNKINFLKTNTNISEEYSPVPAKNILPDWYKKTESYSSSNKYMYNMSKNSTVKKCMPVFDSISSGYLIRLHCDLYIKYNGVSYEFKPSLEEIPAVEFHPKKQVEEYPFDKDSYLMLPKIINYWGIKTRPGYSSLILPPAHRDNVISILPGIVDTDSYNAPVHFPFLVGKDRYTGLIKAGTPIAQVIPFKRESWQMAIEEDLIVKGKTDTKILSVFYNGYKNLFWNKKDYS